MRFDRRGESKCGTCPLDGVCTKVWGESDKEKPKIAFIGEAPGEKEDNEGRPFVGPAGNLLRKALRQVGIQPHTVWLMNVISCRPPNNKMDSSDGEAARIACNAGFRAEIRDLVRRGCRVFIPLGNVPLQAMGVTDLSISKARGSVFEVKLGGANCLVVPTFHPSFILRGMNKQEVTWLNDLEKAERLARSGWTRPTERFLIEPSVDDVRAWVDGAQGCLIGLDLETTSLDPERGEIFVVGLARSGSDALVIPFYKRGMEQYWSPSERREVSKLLRDFLRDAELVIQNALFDLPYLEASGFGKLRAKHDILLLHHAIHPELPHNLGYIVSQFGATPYWKDVVLKSDEVMYKIDDEVLRTYNARDSVVLLQVLPGLLEELDVVGTRETYQTSMALIEPVRQMVATGLKVDEARLKKWITKVGRDAARAEKGIRGEVGIHGGLNLGSGDDMRYVLYGVKPPRYKKAVAYLNGKPREGTKKWVEAVEIRDGVEGTKPLYLTSSMRKTETGRFACDEQAILGIQIAADTRMALIDGMKRRPSHIEEEIREIERLKRFIELWRTYGENRKLLTTYSSFPTKRDGRVKGQYLIHGTATGRLSSRNPNMQNIPSAAKGVFVAEEGNVLVQGDYSNLELRVLAVVSHDPILQEIFEEGRNVHDENTRDLFEIDEGHPRWSAARRAAKVYIFGRNYGGGLRGIFERVAMAVPDLGLSFRQFCELDRRYRMLHPQYVAWASMVEKKVVETRRLENGFGRVRYFLGSEDEIRREGLNFPIQSTAADVMNRALVELPGKLEKVGGTRLCATVHDSIIVECGALSVDRVVDILKQVMEQPHAIEGTKVSFPVDFEVGDDWGSLSAWKPATVRRRQRS